MTVYPERRGGRLTGKWIAEVTQQGQRCRKRFETKQDGERWEGVLKLAGAASAETRSEPSGPTFGQVAREAREHHAGWQRSRDPSLGPRLDYVVAALGEDTPIERIRTTDLDGLVSTLRKRRGSKGDKLSAGTINRYLSVASALLTFARRREYIVGLPVVPWQRETGRRIHWLTENAESAIVQHLAADGHEACALAVRVLAATGLRWSEFASLEASQIDGDWIRLWKTKTNKPRSVPIDRKLGEELRALIEVQGLPRYSTLRKRLRAALKSAGQNTAITIHALRHTTATRLLQRDVQLENCAEVSGIAP